MISWWLILDFYFQIGWSTPDNISDPGDSGDIPRLFDENSHQKQIGSDKSDVITSSMFVKRLLQAVPILERGRCLRDMLAADSNWSSLRLDQTTFEEYEEFRKEFSDLPAVKGAVESEKQIRISGAAQHFFVKNSLDDAASRYHDQLTNLRRENELLRRQNGVALTSSPLHKLLMKRLTNEEIERLRLKYPRLASFYALRLMRRLTRD
jgi:hypothetical protein